MFYALLTNVDGRKSYRYFQKFDNAEQAMLKAVEDIKRSFGAHEVRNLDYFMQDKGIYIREIELQTSKKESFSYAILDEYFED